MVGLVLDTHTIWDQETFSLHSFIIFTVPLCEAPLPAHVDLGSIDEVVVKTMVEN